jgi:hypothetical protein
VPADIAPGSPEYEQAVIMHFALKYAPDYVSISARLIS